MKRLKPLLIHVIRDHIILGALAAILLAPNLGSLGSLLFWAGTVFVDVDHYLRFLFVGKWKAVGIKQMLAFFERSFQTRHHPDFLALDIFHTAEFLIGFAFAVFYAVPSLFPVFLGVVFHMLVDLVHILRHRALTKRAHSFVEYFLRKKRIEARGGSPDALHAKIFQDQSTL